jgi:hypothetical protein
MIELSKDMDGLSRIWEPPDFKRSAQIAASVLIEELSHICRIELVSSESTCKVLVYSTFTEKEEVCAILSFSPSELDKDRPCLLLFLTGRDKGATMEAVARALWTVCGSKPMSPMVLKHLQRAEEERSQHCGHTR